MNKLIVQRIRDNGVITMGRGMVLGNGEGILSFVTLEPSWVLNQPFVSCIPVGTYPLHKRHSEKFDYHLHIKEVPGRTYCLIHTLNYFRQTEGCIGVGDRFGYLNNDDQIDIKNSQSTLDKILNLLPDETTIKISESTEMQRFYR